MGQAETSEHAEETKLKGELKAEELGEEGELGQAEEIMEERELSPAKVTISVKLSVKDMYYFMLRHTYSAFSGWFGIILSLAAFVMLLAGVGEGDQAMTLLLIFMALLFTVINPLILFVKSWKQVKLNAMFQKPISYGFGEDGIEVVQEEERACIFWNEICRVIRSKSYIIIYMSRVRAFILPVKQFEKEYQEVNELIEKKAAKALISGKK